MKWTYDWLKDYLKTDATPAEIADVLTRIGLEVEDVISPIAPIAAKIIQCDAHPDSDHLHVLMVDDATPTPRQIVCGAPNARVGLISALALPGCVIDGHEIKSGKLRGVVSDGMMCSGRELGINDDHSGIIELDANTKIGAPVIDTPTVFDAGITPNRPDYLAVSGIAHDLAAAGVGEYIAHPDGVLDEIKSDMVVNIETDKCPVYRFAEIRGIKICPSDNKIASRLRAIGINPKNAAIDATNYICYDMGQPMHCFDADEIHGNITVRMANDGEEFTDLFGTAHKLTPADMVVADDKGALAVAGVVGGARAMTTDKTSNIILESAYFDPVSVRRSAKRLGISTDASYRYERGISPIITEPSLKRAADIITSACGGKITGVGFSGKNPVLDTEIKYRPDLFSKKMGIDIDTSRQMDILKSLGYDVAVHGDEWTVTPPARRVDVTIVENIISDLARIYGYDKIASSARHIPCAAAAAHDNHELNIKKTLAARGINECRSYGFGSSAVEKLLNDKEPVYVANPIVADFDTARAGLLGGLLTAVSNNEKRGYPDVDLFEIGTVFDGDTPGAQRTAMCIVRTGNAVPRHWTGRGRTHDIYDVKADLMSLMAGQKFTIVSDNPPRWAHPFRYGAIFQGKKKIAEFGELSPVVAKKLRIKTPVMVAIADDINNIPRARRAKYTAQPDFPPITRDFAFITDTDFPAEKIIGAAVSSHPLVTDAIIFDAFDMGDGKKSIAFTITIMPDKNMTDGDLMEIQNAVIDAVEKKCGAKIRDK